MAARTPLSAVLFDIDGTLLDTNDLHARAWVEALGAAGHDVDFGAVRALIGAGGDKLVPTLLGADMDPDEVQRLGDAHGERFSRLLETQRLRAFDGVRDLFEAVHDRGLKVALATSSRAEGLDDMEQAFGLPLRAWADETITASGVDESKPEPDLVEATLHKLRLEPRQAVMVGDTPYDATACVKAGVPFIGLLTGGWDAQALSLAGAAQTYADPADLLAHLDQALASVRAR